MNLNSLKKRTSLSQVPSHLPVVIVGGGINGAGVFRDLSLHQIPCLLIDKFDFSSQTSQSSSKMLHGGIRYLENLDFDLVKEALNEKNLWLKIAPHLAFEDQFILPVYRDSLRPLWMVKMGLFLYDLLSGFENKPHSLLNREETLKRCPNLKREGLTGAGVYADAIMDDVKMTLECIYDGLEEKNSWACNYVGLEEMQTLSKGHRLTLKDQISEEFKTITCDYVVFTTGPFTDKLLTVLKAFPWHPKMCLSKGAHLWIKRADFPLPSPVVLTPNDGRVIFVNPQGSRVLVGTTEAPSEATFNLQASKEEIQYLKNNLKEYFPKLNLKDESVVGSIAGIRPLVWETSGGNTLGEVARHHKIYQPHERVHVLLGGKYTTFRIMAQDVVKKLFRQMGHPYNSNLTLRPLRRRSIILPWQSQKATPEEIEKIRSTELVRKEEDLLRRLSP